jgi:hypothetical protein
MTATQIIRFLVIYSLIGSLAFCLFVFAAFRSGLVYAARNKDGNLKARVPLGGIAAMAGFLLLLIGFFLLANRIGLAAPTAEGAFPLLFALDLALYLILFALDTLVIDAWVLGRWRPSFLKVPPEMGSTSMGEHIRRSLLVGLTSGVLLSLAAAAMSCLMWSRA